MFQKYYFFCYRLFCLNKSNNNKTFSCWRNSTTTFTAGRQLLQIENGKCCQFPCIIPFNPQELCQQNLFHNGNARDYPPLSINKTNTWPNRSPKMPTKNNAIRQNVQQKHSSGREKEKYFEDLEKRFLQLNNNKTLRLLFQKGVTGHKFFEISLFVSGQFFNFYNISVPQDAYPFVKALDELNKELAKENFEQKLNNIKASQSMVGSRPQLKKRELKLRNVLFTGFRHQFQLELVLFINENKGKIEKRICLRLTAINIQATNRNRTLTLPIQTLPWLRKQIAEMLIRHDGTNKIKIEAPAKIQKQSQIPKQFFTKNEAPEFHPPVQKSLSFVENLKEINGPKKRNTADQFDERSMEEIYSKIGNGLANMEKALKEMSKENVELKKEICDLKREIKDVFHASPAQNGINSSHSLKHNGVRPQFVNQKPTYFQQYPKMANITQNSNQSAIKTQKIFMPMSIRQRPNPQQSGVRKPVKISKITQQLDPKTAALERGIQTLFDFDEEEMENYRRISSRINNPSEH